MLTVAPKALGSVPCVFDFICSEQRKRGATTRQRQGCSPAIRADSRPDDLTPPFLWRYSQLERHSEKTGWAAVDTSNNRNYYQFMYQFTIYS